MGRRPIAAVAVVLTATAAGFFAAREISERDVERDGTH
ncbi:MAG: hypothetical protein QOJ12_1108, partial [Thermoleophilales bacterium]|nr:hypothetical protein [Thermoleophilales bacterium]